MALKNIISQEALLYPFTEDMTRFFIKRQQMVCILKLL